MYGSKYADAPCFQGFLSEALISAFESSDPDELPLHSSLSMSQKTCAEKVRT
jgi:hypothetical protein